VLPERTDRLLTLLAETDAYVSEANSIPRVIYVSPNVVDIMGFTPEEIVDGGSIRVHPDDNKTLVDGAVALAKHGQSFGCVIRIMHKRGDWRWLEVTSLASYSSEDGGYRSISLNRDVTELVNAQRNLGESEERYRVLSEMSRDMITESSLEGEITYISPAVSGVLGYSERELLSIPSNNLIHPDDLERLQEIAEHSIANGVEARFESYRVLAKDGRTLWFETSALMYQRGDGEARILAVTHNITDELKEQRERRDLEEHMVSTQKLESLGVMAGGIAHDFNNLLTPIMGEASLGLEETAVDSPLYRRLSKIRRAAERAASLTKQMLSYAGKGPLQLELLDLSHLVDEMGRLFESAVSGRTVLEFDLAPGLPAVEADASQVSQVVMNLIGNASEALSDGEGKITVRTGFVDLEEPPAKAVFAEELVCGRHVFVEVSDTGCGMDPGTGAKIFDPFFTTKFTGRGLGLAAVAGIVRGHRGAVEILSDSGVGTVFRVLFPASTGVTVEPARKDGRAPSFWANDMVLVIDDDAGVRDLACDILSRVGLEVMTAANGRQGVEMFADHADEISLVLLDRTMPIMSGFEAFHAIRKIRPSARVVLVSGYSEERAAAELAGLGLAGFLQKPFAPETLIDLIRNVIDGLSAGRN
jgi:two-component system cell cycle sensor histidine kinase/response regulator CckA